MNTIQEQLAAAEAAYDIGDYSFAAMLANEILFKLPETDTIEQFQHKYKLYFYLSAEELRKGNANEAQQYIENALDCAIKCGNKNAEVQCRVKAAEIARSISRLDEAVKLYMYALAYYKETQQTHNIANMYTALGGIYFTFSRFDDALEHLDLAMHIYKHEAEDKNNLASCFSIKGNIVCSRGDYEAGLTYYAQALELYKQTNNIRGKSVVLGNRAIAYHLTGQMELALADLEQASILSQQINDIGLAAAQYCTSGTIYYHLNDKEKAVYFHNKALEIEQRLSSKDGIARNVGNLGNIYRSMKEYSKALEYFYLALQNYLEVGRENGVAITYNNIGRTYFDMEEYDTAFNYYNKSLTINVKIGAKISEAYNLCYIGATYASPKYSGFDAENAVLYLQKALEIATVRNITEIELEVYEYLYKLYRSVQDYQLAMDYMEKFFLLQAKVRSEEAQKMANKYILERRIALMEKEREISDKLLNMFLPSPIIAEVKEKEGRIVVQKYSSVSVLFADIVGFSKLCLTIEPSILIELLNYVFKTFDTIIKEAGGHRLRTIGDGYFAICGAPDLVENHQYKLAKAALAMQQDVTLPKYIKQELPEGTELDIRIGLHCGEAVCGMVGGLEKWQYDAYGDTINTASRMESHGEPGKIHISEDFKNSLLDYDEFTFIPREPMFIKGKGMMNTYFLQ